MPFKKLLDHFPKIIVDKNLESDLRKEIIRCLGVLSVTKIFPNNILACSSLSTISFTAWFIYNKKILELITSKDSLLLFSVGMLPFLNQTISETMDNSYRMSLMLNAAEILSFLIYVKFAIKEKKSTLFFLIWLMCMQFLIQSISLDSTKLFGIFLGKSLIQVNSYDRYENIYIESCFILALILTKCGELFVQMFINHDYVHLMATNLLLMNSIGTVPPVLNRIYSFITKKNDQSPKVSLLQLLLSLAAIPALAMSYNFFSPSASGILILAEAFLIVMFCFGKVNADHFVAMHLMLFGNFLLNFFNQNIGLETNVNLFAAHLMIMVFSALYAFATKLYCDVNNAAATENQKLVSQRSNKQVSPDFFGERGQNTKPATLPISYNNLKDSYRR